MPDGEPRAGMRGLFAVGTPVARGPPHRSQRAELPHWAPTLGRRQTATNSCLTCPVQRTVRASPALCPVRVLPVRASLGQAPFLPTVRRSRGSLVPVVRRYYGPVRLLAAVHHGVTANGLSHATRRYIPVGWPRDLPVLAHGASTHARGLRPRGARSGACDSTPPGVAFRSSNNVGTPEC